MFSNSAIKKIHHLFSQITSRFCGDSCTCSSSSVRFSPSSLATLFIFRKDIFPVSSSSNSRKALRISSLESFSALRFPDSNKTVFFLPGWNNSIFYSIKYMFAVHSYHFLGHHCHKITERDLSSSILINLCNHFLDFLLFRLKPQRSHGHLEHNSSLYAESLTYAHHKQIQCSPKV